MQIQTKKVGRNQEQTKVKYQIKYWVLNNNNNLYEI